MKEFYTKPSTEIQEFNTVDIVATTSGEIENIVPPDEQ